MRDGGGTILTIFLGRNRVEQWTFNVREGWVLDKKWKKKEKG